MAIVREMKEEVMDRDGKHSEVQSTYSIIHDDSGKRYLQVDTYGSAVRQFPGKKSQSIRFAPEAIQQLKELLKDRFS